VESGAEIGFSGYCTKNNFRPLAGEGRRMTFKNDAQYPDRESYKIHIFQQVFYADNP
jgi:hypothetical protein